VSDNDILTVAEVAAELGQIALKVDESLWKNR
jgi:hypothetical protein